MNEVVVDASAAISYVLPSQTTGASLSFFGAQGSSRLIAPNIFSWEVANVLVRLGSRGLRRPTLEQAVSALSSLEVAVQPAPIDNEVMAMAGEALRLQLTVFDTAYLLLALDRGAALASRDDRLLAVARKFVPCLDLRGETIT